jgi:ribosomal protein L37AE/L43A
VTTKTSKPCSSFGTTCEKCGETLIAPEWSEFVSERLVINIWSCANCGLEFETETETCLSADAEANFDRKVLEAFFPTLLVA